MNEVSLQEYIQNKQEELDDFFTWYWHQQFSQGEYMYPEHMSEDGWDKVFEEQWREL